MSLMLGAIFFAGGMVLMLLAYYAPSLVSVHAADLSTASFAACAAVGVWALVDRLPSREV